MLTGLYDKHCMDTKFDSNEHLRQILLDRRPEVLDVHDPEGGQHLAVLVPGGGASEGQQEELW